MKCDEINILLDPLLDHELPQNEIVAVMTHLENCPACKHELKELTLLRDNIRALKHPTQPPGLRDAIINSLDEEVNPKPSQHVGHLAHSAWSHIAAAVFGGLIVYGSFFLLSLRTSPIDEILTAHVNSLTEGKLIGVTSGNPHKIKPWFAGKLDYAPIVIDSTDKGFLLIGARVDQVDGKQTAALVYKRNDHTINLFVMPAVEADLKTPFTDTLRGFNISRWHSLGFQFWAISDISKADLLVFSKLLRSKKD